MESQTHFGDLIIREYVYNPDTLIDPTQQTEFLADYFHSYFKTSAYADSKLEVRKHVYDTCLGKSKD